MYKPGLQVCPHLFPTAFQQWEDKQWVFQKSFPEQTNEYLSQRDASTSKDDDDIIPAS